MVNKFTFVRHPKYLADVWIDYENMKKGGSAELHIEIWNRNGSPITDDEMRSVDYLAFRNYLARDGQVRFSKACEDVDRMWSLK